MEINEVKAICMVLLFLNTLLFGWPPYFLVRANRQRSNKFNKIRKRIISYLTCFSGGVFLGASLLHLLPEGLEKVEEYLEKTDTTFPIPLYEVMIAAGFFLIALIEQLAHKLIHPSGHAHTHRPEEAGHSSVHEPHPHRQRELINYAEPPVQETEQSIMVPSHGSHSLAKASFTQSDSISSRKETNLQLARNVSLPKDGDCVPTYRVRDIQGLEAGPVSESSSRKEHEETSDIEPEHSHDNEIARALQGSDGNPFRAIMLLIALSFHTIFDGLAVGLASKVSNVWQMFGAICIHKSLVGVYLGTELFLVHANKPLRAFLYIFAFSLITPAGLGLGIILSSHTVDETAQTLTNGLLQGVATGTFFYVTFFEILREELVEKGGLIRLFLVMVGFGGMTAVKLMDSD